MQLQDRAERIARKLTASGVHVTPDCRIAAPAAAAFLGVAEGTLRNWRASGRGPRFIHRARVWYAVDDLLEWLDQGAGKK